MFPDKEIANIAMDISINQTITEELPRLDENGEKCGVYYEDFPELKMKPNESTLYYYQTIMAAKEKKQQSKGKVDSLAGKPGNKDGSSGSKDLDMILDGLDKGKGRNGDWHNLWKELTEGMSEAEQELLRKEIQEAVKRVAEETQRLRGTVPVHISNAMKDNFGMRPPVVSWKTLFKRFVGSTMSTEIYASRKRPNFRFEDAPSNKYKHKVRIVVGMDSSGSVSDEELKEFFGQVKHMWKAGVKIDVCMWDTNVKNCVFA
jgi:predicted metal-dependent peptidase